MSRTKRTPRKPNKEVQYKREAMMLLEALETALPSIGRNVSMFEEMQIMPVVDLALREAKLTRPALEAWRRKRLELLGTRIGEGS